jgi:hypothetical protein
VLSRFYLQWFENLLEWTSIAEDFITEMVHLGYCRDILGLDVQVTNLYNTSDKRYDQQKVNQQDVYVSKASKGDINILLEPVGDGHYNLLDIPPDVQIPVSPVPPLAEERKQTDVQIPVSPVPPLAEERKQTDVQIPVAEVRKQTDAERTAIFQRKKEALRRKAGFVPKKVSDHHTIKHNRVLSYG